MNSNSRSPKVSYKDKRIKKALSEFLDLPRFNRFKTNVAFSEVLKGTGIPENYRVVLYDLSTSDEDVFASFKALLIDDSRSEKLPLHMTLTKSGNSKGKRELVTSTETAPFVVKCYTVDGENVELYNLSSCGRDNVIYSSYKDGDERVAVLKFFDEDTLIKIETRDTYDMWRGLEETYEEFMDLMEVAHKIDLSRPLYEIYQDVIKWYKTYKYDFRISLCKRPNLEESEYLLYKDEALRSFRMNRKGAIITSTDNGFKIERPIVTIESTCYTNCEDDVIVKGCSGSVAARSEAEEVKRFIIGMGRGEIYKIGKNSKK